MYNRVEVNRKKATILKLRTRHMPTREHASKETYNRKRENREWKKEVLS